MASVLGGLADGRVNPKIKAHPSQTLFLILAWLFLAELSRSLLFESWLTDRVDLAWFTVELRAVGGVVFDVDGRSAWLACLSSSLARDFGPVALVVHGLR